MVSHCCCCCYYHPYHTKEQKNSFRLYKHKLILMLLYNKWIVVLSNVEKEKKMMFTVVALKTIEKLIFALKKIFCFLCFFINITLYCMLLAKFKIRTRRLSSSGSHINIEPKTHTYILLWTHKLFVCCCRRTCVCVDKHTKGCNKTKQNKKKNKKKPNNE